jgi:magnesium chelatase subunit D
MEAFLQSIREAVIGLLDRVYVNRDQVSIIQFQKSGATVLLPPTRSVQEARRCVELISQTGGRTPIARALLTGLETGLAAQKRREVEKVLIVAITDADPNVSLSGKKGKRLSYGATWASAFFQTGQNTMVDVQKEVLEVAQKIGNQKNVQLLVIDPERWKQESFGEEIARAANGRFFPLPDVSAESITTTVLDTMAGM